MSQGNRIGMKQVENKPAQKSVPDCAGATFHSFTKHLQTSESTAVQMPPSFATCTNSDAPVFNKLGWTKLMASVNKNHTIFFLEH